MGVQATHCSSDLPTMKPGFRALASTFGRVEHGGSGLLRSGGRPHDVHTTTQRCQRAAAVFAGVLGWARLDSNQRPTDYELLRGGRVWLGYAVFWAGMQGLSGVGSARPGKSWETRRGPGAHFVGRFLLLGVLDTYEHFKPPFGTSPGQDHRDGRGRSYVAYWRDVDGHKFGRTLGPAHVRDTGRRTARGAIIWRAGGGPLPSPEHLTPRGCRAPAGGNLARARHRATRAHR